MSGSWYIILQKSNKKWDAPAGKFIGNIAKICGGGSGGRPNLAQAEERDASKVKEALGVAKAELESGLG